MKNLYKFLGIAALVATVGLVAAGCKTDDDDTPTTSGRLTITGIEAYNGKFAGAYTSGEGGVFLAAGGYGGYAIQISNGQVALPVYKNVNDKISSYSGNDTVVMTIAIFSSKNASYEDPIASGSASVTFVKGIGTVANPRLR